MLFFGPQLKQAKRLIRNGELHSACRLARQSRFTESASGRRFAHRLIDQLVHRAGRSAVCGELEAAWIDLGDAASIAFDKEADRIALEKNRLVDHTIQQAVDSLVAGKPHNAMSAISLLRKRNILDRRSDEVFQICSMIAQAEDLAEAGRINDATSVLQETKQLRPDLAFLDSRIRNYRYQKNQLAELTKQLRYKINESAWQGAQEVSQQMLQIAPRNQIAIDAQRRCADRMPARKPSPDQGDRKMLFINDHGNVENCFSSAPTPIHVENSSSVNQQAGTSVNMDTQPPSSTSVGNRSQSAEAIAKSVQAKQRIRSMAAKAETGMMRSFMLWVDGVGGYLVCTRPEVTIGRARPGCEIDIPLQADLRSRHFQIKRAGDGFLGQNVANRNTKDAHPESGGQANDWEVLKDQQKLILNSGVEAMFTRPNPLGGSARIEFTSRHRTEPWSDAVLLMGDAILLGPDRSNHVVCGRWTQSLVVFRRGDQLILRIPGDGELELSDQSARLNVASSGTTEVVLSDGIRVASDEFTISCEQVS